MSLNNIFEVSYGKLYRNKVFIQFVFRSMVEGGELLYVLNLIIKLSTKILVTYNFF